MAKRNEKDILWTMLSSELTFDDVRELEAWLDGESDYTEMGYGRLMIESYDGTSGGRAGTFRLRHDTYGGLTVTRAALGTVLNDLVHDIRRRKQDPGGSDYN